MYNKMLGLNPKSLKQAISIFREIELAKELYGSINRQKHAIQIRQSKTIAIIHDGNIYCKSDLKQPMT